MGQAFFSLSINGAGMLIYGSYMKKDEDIIKHSGYTALLDTLAALLAGFAILPAVFAFQIPLNSGPSLMFVTLPQVFAQMPAGRIFAILFFISVFFAGITSLVNMMEACSEALSSRLKLSRTWAVWIIAAVVFGVSLFLESLPKMDAWLDAVTIYISPFGAVLCAVFIYFLLGIQPLRAELERGRTRPLSRAFPVIGYSYVILSALVVLFGILYGGIG